MSHPRFRLRLLCEDRLAERFLRALCRRHGIERPEVVIAPEGAGSAAAWVARRYPASVKWRRSKNSQRNLGLLVHMDGDNRGVDARKAELENCLREASLEARASDETIAIFVPTWCIETWLLHLGDLATPAETVQLKRPGDERYRREMNTIENETRRVITKAAAAWPSEATASLADAKREARRLGWE